MIAVKCRSCGFENDAQQTVCSQCRELLQRVPDKPQNHVSSEEDDVALLRTLSGLRPFPTPPALHVQTPSGSSQPSDPNIGRQIGNFRLFQKMASGGFGAVYRAEHILLPGMFVAVKLLHPHILDDDEQIGRFRQEAGSIAHLRHDNVVRLIDHGVCGDHQEPYLIMDFLVGKTLEQCLQDKEFFSIPRMLDLIRQICSVLVHAHRLGIVHRDLKPLNIFLVRDDFYYDKVKILDYGIAKLKNSSIKTQAGSLMGTPSYMSPEQANLLPDLDGRSDLYSLAVIVFRLLTGTLPFRGDLEQLRHAHVYTPPPWLLEVMPTRPWAQELEEFMIRALHKDRNQRPSNASAFFKECEQALYAQDRLEPVPLLTHPTPIAPQPKAAIESVAVNPSAVEKDKSISIPPKTPEPKRPNPARESPSLPSSAPKPPPSSLSAQAEAHKQPIRNPTDALQVTFVLPKDLDGKSKNKQPNHAITPLDRTIPEPQLVIPLSAQKTGTPLWLWILMGCSGCFFLGMMLLFWFTPDVPNEPDATESMLVDGGETPELSIMPDEPDFWEAEKDICCPVPEKDPVPKEIVPTLDEKKEYPEPEKPEPKPFRRCMTIQSLPSPAWVKIGDETYQTPHKQCGTSGTDMTASLFCDDYYMAQEISFRLPKYQNSQKTWRLKLTRIGNLRKERRLDIPCINPKP